MSELNMVPYDRWAAANPHRAPCDKMLFELLDRYEADGLSLAQIAIDMPHVSPARVHSWVARARGKRNGTIKLEIPHKEEKKVPAEWLAVCNRAELRRLLHLAKIRRQQRQAPDLSAFDISTDMRQKELWP